MRFRSITEDANSACIVVVRYALDKRVCATGPAGTAAHQGVFANSTRMQMIVVQDVPVLLEPTSGPP